MIIKKFKIGATGGSPVAEHPPRQPKVKGSSLPISAKDLIAANILPVSPNELTPNLDSLKLSLLMRYSQNFLRKSYDGSLSEGVLSLNRFENKVIYNLWASVS